MTERDWPNGDDVGMTGRQGSYFEGTPGTPG